MELSIFYKEIEKLRKDDPYSHSGKESDRSLSARFGVSHRLIKLWREGNKPDLSTISMICERLNLSEDQFLTLVYAATGKYMTDDDIPIFDQTEVRYADCQLKGNTIGRISRFNFKVPVTVIKKAYRAIRLSEDDKFQDEDVPKGSIVILSLSRNEPLPSKLYVFANPDGSVFLRRCVIRGRQIWLQGGIEDAYKVGTQEFQDTVVGQIMMVIKKAE
jgi:transcriptional regulator with XRE-family HTH domain